MSFLIREELEKEIPELPMKIIISDNTITNLIIFLAVILIRMRLMKYMDTFSMMSCDAGDALQMMMRFRNVRSNSYYIYIDQRPTRKIILDDVAATRDAIREYVLSKPGRIRMQSDEVDEKYRIPQNAIRYNYIESCRRR